MEKKFSPNIQLKSFLDLTSGFQIKNQYIFAGVGPGRPAEAPGPGPGGGDRTD